MAGSIKCPNCKSANVEAPDSAAKGLSVAKTVEGAIITGSIDLLADFLGEKGKHDMTCADCGHKFQV